MKLPLEKRISSSQINNLIIQFRANDFNAGLELIELFRSLVGKYVNLFLKGEFKETDKDTIIFLESFGSIETKLVAGLIKKRLKIYSAKEIIGLCRVCVLLTAKSYMNISGCYKLVMKEQINLLLREDFPEGSPPIIPSEEDLLGENKGYRSSKIFKSLEGIEKRLIEEVLINKVNSKEFILKEGITKIQYNNLIEEIKKKASSS